MKLTSSQLKPVRDKIRADQKGLCALCSQPVSVADAVLDHCHTHGFIRGTLHRSCNSLLGVLENNRKRFGLGDDAAFAAFMAGAGAYIVKHITPQTRMVHPTFKTEEEKRLARNAKARKARAAGKVTK